MSQSYKLIFFSTVYTVLAFILVSLDSTYSITHTIFGGNKDYGTGISLNSKGFYVHLVVFALLIAIPMLMCKSGEI
jgi:predicted Na+-dependent transporter